MEHIIQLAISVEDEKIVKRVEQTAEEQIIDRITKKVEGIIYEKRFYGSDTSDEPLRRMVREQIEKVIEENKETILDAASKHLADKLARTKAAKAIVDSFKEE